MSNSITYVAMDTHKKEHHVALHYPGQEGVTGVKFNLTAWALVHAVNKDNRLSRG